MDKLAYHYNKKKLSAKTAGKYLYYYPYADIKNATAYMGGRGFITIEVTEKEWEALIELEKLNTTTIINTFDTPSLSPTAKTII